MRNCLFYTKKFLRYIYFRQPFTLCYRAPMKLNFSKINLIRVIDYLIWESDKTLLPLLFLFFLKKNPEWYFRLSIILEKQNKIQAAIKAMHSALSMSPNNTFFAEQARERNYIIQESAMFTSSQILLQREKIFNKIAVLLFYPAHLDHLYNIMLHLDPRKIDIIYEDRESSIAGDQTAALLQVFTKLNLNEDNYNLIPLSKALGLGLKWKVSLSVLSYQIGLIPRLSKFSIRMMYGMGKAKWIHADWNREYDLILAHGRYSEEIFHREYGLRVKKVGYPRYSNINSIQIKKVRERVTKCKTKKIVLWLPTWNSREHILSWISEINSIESNDLTVILRPHPLTFIHENDLIDDLRNTNLLISPPEDFTLEELFAIADLVLHNFGGTALGSLFLNKKLAFLRDRSIDPLELNNRKTDSPEIILLKNSSQIEYGTLKKALPEILNTYSHENSRILDLKNYLFYNPAFDHSQYAAQIINKEFETNLYFQRILYLKLYRFFTMSFYQIMSLVRAKKF